MNKFKTSTGYDINYIIVPNTVAYKGLSSRNLEPPKIPQIEITPGVMENNYHSPKYAEAVSVFNKTVELAMVDIVLESAIVFNKKWKETDTWKQSMEMLYSQHILPRSEPELFFLKFFVFQDLTDLSILAEKVFLTETRVYEIFRTVHIQREGIDIHKSYLKNTVDTQIEIQPMFVGIHQLVNPLDEFNSCVASNMNWSNWYNGKYSLDEKASSVALSRLNRIREIHSDDAIQIESEKKNKSNSK